MAWFLMFLEFCIIGATGLLVVSALRSSSAGAPFVPMFRRYVRRLVAFADIGPTDIVCEVGCGDGRFSLEAVKSGDAVRAIGYDIARFPLLLARLRAHFSGVGSRATFERRDIRTCRIPVDTTVVYAYLMSESTNRLAETTLTQLAPGARVVSACFPIDTVRNRAFRLIRSEKIGVITAYLYERV